MFIEINPFTSAHAHLFGDWVNGAIAVETQTRALLYRSRGRSRSGTGTTYFSEGRRFKAFTSKEAIEIANKKWCPRVEGHAHSAIAELIREEVLIHKQIAEWLEAAEEDER